MFLAQALRTPSLHVVAIADLSIPRARAALHRAGWPDDRAAAPSCARALATGDNYLTEDADAMIAADGLKIVIEATGDPARGRPPCTLVLPSRARDPAPRIDWRGPSRPGRRRRRGPLTRPFRRSGSTQIG